MERKVEAVKRILNHEHHHAASKSLFLCWVRDEKKGSLGRWMRNMRVYLHGVYILPFAGKIL